MSMVFNMVGGGGGGNELVVTAPTGSTVTATKDGVTKSANENNGVYTFKGLEAGDWTVTATKGNDTASKVVTVSTEVAILYTTASTIPKSGVTYDNGIGGLDAATVSLFGRVISDNSEITNKTSVVYIDHGTVHRKVSVGDQVSLSLSGASYLYDIIGFNHDTLTDADAYGAATETGLAGMTIQMHDLHATSYPMNSSTSNSCAWKNSVMRTSTMVDMKGRLPDDWEGIIKPVNKTSGLGGGTTSGTETVSDSCFLLAEVEVFGDTSFSVTGEGVQYAYYKAGNSKIKKQNGSAKYWWTRSPVPNSSTYFCFVSEGGSKYNDSAGGQYGVAFAFCI